MVDLPRGLRRMVRIVRALTLAGAAAEIVGWVWMWTSRDVIRGHALELSGVGPGDLFLDARAQWLGALASLPLAVTVLCGLWHLWRLLGEYGAGRIFAPGTQTYLRRAAWALLLGSLLDPLQYVALSLVFTLGNPPGRHWLNVAVSSEIFFPILLSAVLLTIAIVLSEASRISEENGRFI